MRDRLIDMLAKARRSDSTDELDQMQIRGGRYPARYIALLRDGAIEEGALTAFSIALEQFHNAVADRKTLLNGMPQNLQRAGAQFRATGSL